MPLRLRETAVKRRSKVGGEPIRARRRKTPEPKGRNAPKAVRYRRMLNLVKKARISAEGDPLIGWLKPFMTPRKYQKDQVLFRKGDIAKELFVTETGRFLVVDMDVELLPGRFFGELGIFAPRNRRIQTVKCTEDGDVLAIAYEKLLELFRNPKFAQSGFGFLLAAMATQARSHMELQQSYGLIQQQATQLEVQSRELAKFNQGLEQRVTDQVGEIERIGRLRRFLPPQVADLIVASGAEKQLESHRREITALFGDLRGFTGFSESSDPEDVMALLRDYHAAIGEKINEYSGTLERYAGDGVMVVFNDPVPVDNPALKAVLMALEMRDAIGALTEKWRLGHDIGFGIGIAHGFATLGTIGFEGRFDYAAIGTVSNVASRLCDEAKPGQILISPRVLMAVEDAVTVEPVGEFTLKGIRRPLAAYNVLAAVSQKVE
jgi:class 3 adenylate cyclase